MGDYLTIEMPKFRPNYRRWKRYGWKRPKERENSKEVLLEAGRGYCMYCYTRIQVAGKYMGDLEHAIERRNSVLLEECIPNIGIACPVCNESFKRIGEKKRRLDREQIYAFCERARCSETVRKQCTVPCKALKMLQTDYYQKEDSHIILQPMGAKGRKSRQYCTGQLMAFVRQVVDQQGKVPKYEYNNLVVELFAEKLSGKTEEEVLKICQAIYIIGFPSI